MSNETNPHLRPNENPYRVATTSSIPTAVDFKTTTPNWRDLGGRIGRLRFVARMSLLVACDFPLMFLTLELGPTLGGYATSGFFGILMPGIFVATFIVLVAFTALLVTQRLHDMNLVGWWGWTLVFMAVAALLLVFIPGQRGANRFGPPPPPNSIAVHVLAWAGIIAGVVLMLATY